MYSSGLFVFVYCAPIIFFYLTIVVIIEKNSTIGTLKILHQNITGLDLFNNLMRVQNLHLDFKFENSCNDQELNLPSTILDPWLLWILVSRVLYEKYSIQFLDKTHIRSFHGSSIVDGLLYVETVFGLRASSGARRRKRGVKAEVRVRETKPVLSYCNEVFRLFSTWLLFTRCHGNSLVPYYSGPLSILWSRQV